MRNARRKARRGEAYGFMVRAAHARRRRARRAVAGTRRPGRRGRQRHAADHDPAEHPAPRRPQGRPAQPSSARSTRACLDPGGLRRRQAQRPGCPAPIARRALRRPCARPRRAISRALRCRGREPTADIWLDGEKVDPRRPRRRRSDEERADLRRAPTCRASSRPPSPVPDDNCDRRLHANDLGYLAVVEDERLVGYNVLVGGGLGRTHQQARDVPAPGRPLGFVRRERAARGRRGASSRSTATSATAPTASTPGSSTSSTTGASPGSGRKVEESLGWPLAGPLVPVAGSVRRPPRLARAGRRRAGSSACPIENGRINDEGAGDLRSALRALAVDERHRRSA